MVIQPIRQLQPTKWTANLTVKPTEILANIVGTKVARCSEASKRFDPAQVSVRKESEATNHPPQCMGGSAGGPSLLDSMAAMGANPRTCTIAQVIAFLSFVCPSISTRAIQLEWPKG